MPEPIDQPAQPPRAAWRWLLLLVGAFGFFGAFARGYVEDPAGDAALTGARAWYLRGTPALRSTDDLDIEAGDETWPAEQWFVEDIDGGRSVFGRRGMDGARYVTATVGQQALLIPFVALGDRLARIAPAPEVAYEEAVGAVPGQFFWTRMCASLLSPLAGAIVLVLLTALCRTLGSTAREALLVAAIATVGTQFWPGALDFAPDTIGACFLAGTALLVAQYDRRGRDPGFLLFAGAVGGLGLLVVPALGLPLVAMWAWSLLAAIQRRRPSEAVWFVLGCLPGVALLAYADQAWFGIPFARLVAEWERIGTYDFWGLPLTFAAPGKGILLFTPILFLALAQTVRKSFRTPAGFCALAALLVPLPIWATTPDWAGAPGWGIRHLSGAIALFVAIALALGRPWQRIPRAFPTLALLGVLISMGGILTPYTGQQAFAYRAAELEWQEPAATLSDAVHAEPRYSPLHTHWIYAWLTRDGRLDPIPSVTPPQVAAADSIRPLFDVAAPGTVPAPRPEEIRFRHFWWRHLATYWPDGPILLIVLGWLGSAIVFLALGIWSTLRIDRWARAAD